jgi:TonB family protein
MQARIAALLKVRGFTMSKIALTICALTVLLTGGHGLAQTSPQTPASAPTANPNDPLVAYRAYNAAVANNDFVQAATQAALAWRAAEATWGGSNPNTAGLAYNAAWSSALIGKSAERVDAARRAVELAPKATSVYDLSEAQFLLAYSSFFAAKPEERAKLASGLAAAALPVEATWPDYLLVNALVQSAKSGVSEVRGRVTVGVAERALVALERLTPNDKDSRVIALVARAQGRLLGRFDEEEAIADLIQARVVYGPMRQPDDLTWGVLGAWELAARSLVQSNDSLIGSATGSRVAQRSKRPLRMTKEQLFEIYKRQLPNSLEAYSCIGVTFVRRGGTDISYPAGEGEAGRIAGVIIRHDIAADGRTTNVRLLGAVPPGPFGDNALAAVRTWRFTVPANTPQGCLRDQDVGVSFAIG